MTAAQLIMQYPIALPSDYDMAIIHERVRARGRALDDRAGLLFKAYGIRERGVAGATHNEYAPFYAWQDATAAADFLWRQAGFQGVVTDFGRPVVHTWVPVAQSRGSVPAAEVRWAAVRTTHVRHDTDLAALAAQLAETTAGYGHDVHYAVAGIDPTSWQAVEFVSGDTCADPPEAGWTRYTVLHVSEPG